MSIERPRAKFIMGLKLTINTKFYFLLGALIMLGAVNRSSGQGTAFTYQGQLQENGAPVSGAYNMTFSLFDTSSGGNAVAGPVTDNGVTVNAGLFTVIIDFGPGAFAGGNNWMEIGVQTNGAASFTIFGSAPAG